jgi:hypothetical protein
MFGNINNCHNVKDFRNLAKKRLPSPIFHYIDGAADDEITYKRNTDAYEQCDLIPNVLSGVDKVDMSTTVMGQKLDISSILAVPKEEIPNIVPNFSAAFATPISPS